MTVTNVTPTEPTNEPQNNTQPIDNMGNPIDDKGNPIEGKEVVNDGGETVESLQKALKDTKAELTKLQQEKAQKQPNQESEGDPESTEGDDTKLEIEQKKAEEAGVDFSKYSEEYNSQGGLSDESYEELAKKGYDRQLVDDYIEGQKARVHRQTQEVATVVGGEDNLAPVLEWAAENLSEEEINIYNSSVRQSTTAAKLALQGIYSRYVAANGKAPNLVKGDGSTAGADIFKSPFEMQKAQQDPRYWNDPDFQKEVEEKIRRSMKAGTV